MRKGGIIAVLVLAGLGFVASFFITDEWIESKAEYQASVLNGAKVELDGFEFSFWGMQVSWDRLQVANRNNTMQNTFETGMTNFSMATWPLLLANKVMVDEVKVTGFRMDTERETDGTFEIPEEEAEQEPGFLSSVVNQVSSEVQKNAAMKFDEIGKELNVDALVGSMNIESAEKIDSLRQDYQNTYAKWEETLQNTSLMKEIEQIEQQLNEIDVKGIKDPKKVVEALQQVSELKEKADSLKSRSERLKKEYEEDFGSSQNITTQMNAWIQEDYERALSRAELPDLDLQNMGKALFAQSLLGDYAAYLDHIALVRKYGDRLIGSSDEEPEIPRYEGLDIRFSDKYDWPGFWFKNVELSGQTKGGLTLSGTLTHISSNQKKAGHPMRIELSGENENAVSLKLNGTFNYLEEEPMETFNLNYRGFGLSDSRLSRSPLLPYKLDSGTGSILAEVNLTGDQLDSRVEYTASDLEFDLSGKGNSDDRLQQLIRDAIRSTDQITVTALVGNSDGPLRVRVRSNLDNLISDAFRKTLSRELDQAKRKVRMAIDEQLAGKKEELQQFRQKKEAEIREKYQSIQAAVDEQLTLVEQKKKELEEKKKELENAAKDKIKNKIGIDL